MFLGMRLQKLLMAIAGFARPAGWRFHRRAEAA